MYPHVSVEATSSGAGLVALFADKRPFSTLNQHVSFQICSTDAWETALVATLGLFPIMQKHVRFDIFGHLK